MTTLILLGIDVGTSDSKVLATTLAGREVVVQSTPTRWRTDGDRVDADAWHLVDAVIALAAATVRAASDRIGPVQVGGLAVTGMAESGTLLSADGVPRSPVIAWFDSRGEQQLSTLPAEVAAAFPGTTGLPVGPQATLAKLLWLRESGIDLAAGQWLHIPELIVHRLGGARGAETSLLARTGLLDQHTAGLWPAALDLLGVTDALLPPTVPAGAPMGLGAGPHCPQELRGAALTVAGHDHPVAAIGCGAAAPGVTFDSFGTAEAFVRTLDAPLSSGSRERLVAAGINAVRNVLPDFWHLLAGTKAGLVMRRTLALLGLSGTARDAMDAAAAESGTADLSSVVEVSGAANDDGTLRISAPSDAVDPVGLWLAAVRHGIDEGNRLLAAMSAEVGPSTGAVVAGGWTRMASVRREKQRQLPQVRFADRAQAGAFGAAAFAAFAHHAVSDTAGPAVAGPTAADLDGFVTGTTASRERTA